jgi:hypothetical protein
MRSYLESSSDCNPHALIHALSALDRSEFASKPPHSVDRAIDAALRSVPLPDGLMTRLGKLAYAMPDETADQVDCLGC